jgi:cell division protease FtsH
MRLPEGDRVSLAIDKIKADLAVAMGGRVAEDLVFGTEKITTGASGDIQMATSLAHHMVTEWGMSEKLGMIRYSAPDNQEGYSSSAAARIKNLSDKTAEMVDSEIRRIIDTAYNRATELLTKHRSQLDAVANALLEYETLSGDDIKTIMEGGKIDRPEPAPEQRVIKTKTGTSMPVGGQTVEA